MKTIILPKNIRTFLRRFENKPLLCQSGRGITAGTKIEIGETVTMNYDHRDQLCVPILGGKEEFFLLSEMGELNKQ